MIIESLLDTDLYKFTMMQSVLHQFPGAKVTYKFKCRTPGVDLSPLAGQIRSEIEHLCSLRCSDEDLAYLSTLRFMKSDFIDFLSVFHLKTKHVKVEKTDKSDCGLAITVAGPWLHTILFEIPILAIVSELYFRRLGIEVPREEGLRRLDEKVAMILAEPDHEGFRLSDFGTRRRFSRDWQSVVLNRLVQTLPRKLFSGTSNVLFAKELNLIPMGTMAHEYLQAAQALGPRLRDSQKFAFESWAKEYRGDLGIALSDVYGLKPFLKDFDMYFCKLFDGVRHDSGDPFVWGESIIEHYKKNKCDPASKTLIFSDALTIPLALELYRRFHKRIKLGFGIGTNLTNDVGVEPLNIVMKMVSANGCPVAKISDSPGKGMCEDPTYLAYLRQVFGIEAPKS